MTAAPQENVVYGLVDPRTLLIHYVGQSTWGLEGPKTHRNWSTPETRCRQWAKSLERRGLAFDVVVLEAVAVSTDLAAAKRWWMNYGRASGWPLTNSFKHQEPCDDAVIKREQRARKLLTVQISVTTEQKKTFADAAAKAGLTLSSWLLTVGIQAARNQK